MRIAQPLTLADPALLDGSAPRPTSSSWSPTACCCRSRLLDWPRLGCVNLHASLLPRWRGAAPIQHAHSRRRRDDGHQPHATSSAASTPGRVYLARATPIGERETAGAASDAARRARPRSLLAATRCRIAHRPAGSARCRSARSSRRSAPKIAKSEARDSIGGKEAVELDARRFARSTRGRSPRGSSTLGRAPADLGGRARALGACRPLRRPARSWRGAAGIDVAHAAAARCGLLGVQPPSARVMAAAAYLAAHPLEGAAFVPEPAPAAPRSGRRRPRSSRGCFASDLAADEALCPARRRLSERDTPLLARARRAGRCAGITGSSWQAARLLDPPAQAGQAELGALIRIGLLQLQYLGFRITRRCRRPSMRPARSARATPRRS